MRNTTSLIGGVTLVVLGVCGLCPADAAAQTAQTYDIPWHAPAGGGTPVASGGPYTITGTAGQPDAGPIVTGGPYSIAGGFWVAAAAATPAGADLSITLNDSVDPVLGNQPLVYTATITNNGPAAATAISVATVLAPGLVFNDASGDGWTCHESGGVVTCTRGNLAAGAAPLISIVVTAPASAAGPLTTTATVHATETDPAPGNNTASAATTVIAAPASAPTITITAPAAAAITVSTPDLMVEGVASGAAALARVTWSNDRGGHGIATGTTVWSVANITLSPGRNVITATATDVNGATGSAVVIVTLAARTYYLSEGATGGFFETDIALANPNGTGAPVVLTFYKPDGSAIVLNDTLPALSRKTLVLNDVAGLEAVGGVSTRVTSLLGLPIVVERTMAWDRSGYGAHGEKAAEALALQWYFAEGSQGFFHTYLLLANPSDQANVAIVQYLRESEPPITRTYALLPTSRLTVDAGADAALVGRSFGMIVSFDQPGMAERAMYFGNASAPFWSGGHDSAGETAPSTTWFLAEGATGPFFETFLLLANPGDTDATATLTYLPSSGVPVTKTTNVPAHARVTVNIEGEDPSLANAAVSTQVVATQPILVERSQYWPDPAPNWYEAHNSFGVTALGTKWGLAEGRVGNVDGVANAQTYILLANAGSTPANVTITFLRDNGATPVTKTFTVPPTSRFNVPVGPGTDVPELANENFGALITSDQPIAVERALYWDANGQVWAAGTNATATRLP